MGYFQDFMDYSAPDHRLENYPLMSQPWFSIIIIIIYIYLVYFYLPAYMANRKPYNLKTVLTMYNIFQVIASSISVYGLATSGWTTRYKLTDCVEMEPPEDQMGMRMAKYMWLTWLLRIVELSETIFFVLRKKFDQVRFLHTYHHSTGVILGWWGLRTYPGGMFTFGVMLNSSIHVVMYTYYMLSAMGPEAQKFLKRIKSKITMIQLIQFIVLLVHGSQLLKPSCPIKVSWLAIIVGELHIINLFLLFLHFYITTYTKKTK